MFDVRRSGPLNPQPSTLNPQPFETLNPQPSTLNHAEHLLQQLELRVRNEPLTGPGRLCISNIEPHLLQRNLRTATLASFILLA